MARHDWKSLQSEAILTGYMGENRTCARIAKAPSMRDWSLPCRGTALQADGRMELAIPAAPMVQSVTNRSQKLAVVPSRHNYQRTQIGSSLMTSLGLK